MIVEGTQESNQTMLTTPLNLAVVAGGQHTSSTTTPASPEGIPSMPVVGLIGIIVCLSLAVVSCTTIVIVRYCDPGHRRSGSEGGSTDQEQQGGAADRQQDGASSNMDPPRYRDALRMQRLDSTTIPGTPPPLYKSLDLKLAKLTGTGGHDNNGFQFTPPYNNNFSFSRSVSVVSDYYDALFVRTPPSSPVTLYPQEPSIVVEVAAVRTSDAQHFQIAESSSRRPDSLEEVIITQSPSLQSANIDESHCTEPGQGHRHHERQISSSLSLSDVNDSASTLTNDTGGGDSDTVDTVSARVDEQSADGTNTNAHARTTTLTDMLPTYRDVLSWIRGTKL